MDGITGEPRTELFVPKTDGHIWPVGGATDAQRLRAVKFVDGSDDLIEGLAIPFSGPLAGKDLDGEDFGPDTDLALDWFPQGRPLTYNHGTDRTMKTAVQGRQVEHEITDEGVWARAQLDKSAKYHSAVSRMVAAGKLFFSSGSMPHLVEVDGDGHIKRWPWVELAMTPTPANPLAVLHYAKASDIVDRLAALDLTVPAPLIALALKALDSEDPEAWTVPSALEAKAGRVSAAVAEFRDHARESLDMRAKAGRVLSGANRDRINAALASREAVLSAYEDLEALLAETDPEAKSAALASLDREVAETLRRAALATL